MREKIPEKLTEIGLNHSQKKLLFLPKYDILTVQKSYLCNLHNEVFGGAKTRINTEGFLPAREGVSLDAAKTGFENALPPCTGGCIHAMLHAMSRTHD